MDTSASSENWALDRALQLDLLKRLRETYPDGAEDVHEWPPDPASCVRNLAYLREHGLVEVQFSEWMNDQVRVVSARITAHGLDFIADDGGLSAILGVVTVKLHADTVEAIEQAIHASNLPPDQKKKFLDQLRALPGDAIKHLTTKLMDLALENWPAALPLIQRAIEAAQR